MDLDDSQSFANAYCLFELAPGHGLCWKVPLYSLPVMVRHWQGKAWQGYLCEQSYTKVVQYAKNKSKIHVL